MASSGKGVERTLGGGRGALMKNKSIGDVLQRFLELFRLPRLILVLGSQVGDLVLRLPRMLLRLPRMLLQLPRASDQLCEKSLGL
jgi:hypothetical protein